MNVSTQVSLTHSKKQKQQQIFQLSVKSMQERRSIVNKNIKENG
jgi:hypothetical protein